MECKAGAGKKPAPCRLVAVLGAVLAVPAWAAGDRILELESALRRNSRDLAAYKELTRLLVEKRSYDSAIQWSKRGLAVAPKDPDLSLAQSAALIGSGRAAEALPMLQGLPASGQGRFLLGMAHRALRNPSGARTALLEAWNLGHHDPYLLYTVIEQDRALGDKERGLEHFKLFWTRFPKSAWLHVLLADAHFSANEDQAAKDEYQKALELDPKIPLAHFHLGYLAFGASDYAAAERHFRSEIEVNPVLGEAHAYLGTILRRQGKPGGAVAVLERALRLDPESPLAYQELSAIQLESGELSKALQTLQEARRRFPQNAGFSAQLATVLRRLGRTAEARGEAERADKLMRDKLHRREREVMEKK